jgi:hypothetical protein
MRPLSPDMRILALAESIERDHETAMQQHDQLQFSLHTDEQQAVIRLPAFDAPSKW